MEGVERALGHFCCLIGCTGEEKGELEGGGRIRALAVGWLQLRLGIILVHMFDLWKVSSNGHRFWGSDVMNCVTLQAEEALICF